MHSDLEFKVRENEAKSLELRESIRNLWDLLQIPSEEQEAFLATAPKHTPSNIAKVCEFISFFHGIVYFLLLSNL